MKRQFTDEQALEQIRQVLSGQEWDADSIGDIAAIVTIATVTAKTEHAAIRKAPQPYRKALGEIYAVRVKE